MRPSFPDTRSSASDAPDEDPIARALGYPYPRHPGPVLFDPATTFSFPKPTSQQAYEGAILPVPIPGDVLVEQQARAIGALLQGAFMRTTLAKDGDLDACKKKQFYKNKPVNEYAKAIHKPAIKKLAYAFGFDDTCSQSSYIGVHNPTSMLIKILPLKDKKK